MAWRAPLEQLEVSLRGLPGADTIGERSAHRPAEVAGLSGTVDLRTSRGGSIGRIPVDMDPASSNPNPEDARAGAREERTGQTGWDVEQEVRWLRDEDDLAGQLHRLLRRQARRKGIELT